MTTNIQPLLLDKDYYTGRQVIQFLHRNNITPTKPIHTTNKYYRCRLIEPQYGNRYYYRKGTLTEGLDCVYQMKQ